MGVFARDHAPITGEQIDDEENIFRVHSEDPFATTKKFKFAELLNYLEEKLKEGLRYELPPIMTTAAQLVYNIGDLVDFTVARVIVNNMVYRPNQFTWVAATGELTLNVDPADIKDDMYLILEYYKYA